MGSSVVARITRAGLLPLLLLGTLGTGLASAPRIMAAAAAPTSIAITVPPQGKIGADLTLTARLTTNGQAVTSRTLHLVVDAGPIHTQSVDGNGVALFRIPGAELTTAHLATVTVRFDGSASLSGSTASALVRLLPVAVTVETVPRTDGIPITLGSAKATTLNGVARLDVAKLGTYVLSADVGSASRGATRTDFVRWSDEMFSASRDLAIKGDVSLQLGVHIAHRGSFEFVDAHGAPVPADQVKSVTLTSTGGTQLTLTNYENVWLDAGTAVKRLEGLDTSTRNWRVLTVDMAGTSVVNRGQQRIEPAPGAVWKVELLLYDLRVEAHDALFGSSLSGRLELVYPDGSTRFEQLGGANPQLLFSRLPRGDYTLVLHAGGLGAPTPVVLSRDQSAGIRVITYLDLGVFVSLLVVAAAALLWFGRRQQVLSAASGVQAGATHLRGGIDRRIAAAMRHGRAMGTATSARWRKSVRDATTRVASRTLATAHSGLHGAGNWLATRRLLSIAGPLRAGASSIRIRRRLESPPASVPDEAKAPSLAAVLSRTLRESPTAPGRVSASAAPDTSRLRARSISKPGPVAADRGAEATCPTCGHRVSSRARYCVTCGGVIPGRDQVIG